MLKPKYLSDFLVIGGGTVGLSVARSLTSKYPRAKILVMEKEHEVSEHGSGRNSGVLHAGFYYATDSLKATFCRLGNEMWTEYCEENRIPILKCGKIVVPKNERDRENMYDLYEQGKKNQVELYLISRSDALKIDSMVTGFGNEFLWSPTTSVVDSKGLVKYMGRQLEYLNPNVQILRGTKYIRSAKGTYDNHRVVTDQGLIESKYLINAAGQQSLLIAQEHGVGEEYDFFPMKGLYAISDKRLHHTYKTLVYPVPIKGAPFLGVHSTLTMDGRIKIGPTVAPAFSIENYQGLQNLNPEEALRIMRNYFSMLFSSKEQRKIIWAFIREELPKLSIPTIVEDVSKIHKMNVDDFKEFYRPGIRSQLINKKTLKLQQDFILEFSKKNQLHILNLVSPGFTCSLPFAEYIVKEIDKRM